MSYAPLVYLAMAQSTKTALHPAVILWIQPWAGELTQLGPSCTAFIRSERVESPPTHLHGLLHRTTSFKTSSGERMPSVSSTVMWFCSYWISFSGVVKEKMKVNMWVTLMYRYIFITSSVSQTNRAGEAAYRYSSTASAGETVSERKTSFCSTELSLYLSFLRPKFLFNLFKYLFCPGQG